MFSNRINMSFSIMNKIILKQIPSPKCLYLDRKHFFLPAGGFTCIGFGIKNIFFLCFFNLNRSCISLCLFKLKTHPYQCTHNVCVFILLLKQFYFYLSSKQWQEYGLCGLKIVSVYIVFQVNTCYIPTVLTLMKHWLVLKMRFSSCCSQEPPSKPHVQLTQLLHFPFQFALLDDCLWICKPLQRKSFML